VSTKPCNSIDEIFSRLEQAIPSYEQRSQQRQLAEEIARAFDAGRVGIFEAGTGTGKSFAALIPAFASGRKVVVSTATIALQEQYIHKDIPALQSAFPHEIKAALLKGRSNYLGLRRYGDQLLEQEIDPRLVEWAENTEFGDVSELDFSPPVETWLEINSDSDDCLRNKCPSFSDCHYFQARAFAEEADVLVVNHSLLLADAVSEGNVLPPYELLVVDEAHQMPEIATKAFSVTISTRGLQRLANRSLKNVGAPAHLVHNLEEIGAEFFHELYLSVPLGKCRLRKPARSAQEFLLAVSALRDWLSNQEFEQVLDVDNQRDRIKAKARALISSAKRFISCLELVLAPSEEWVLWTEKTEAYGGKIEVVAAPLKVDELLNEYLFSKSGLHSSVWMSATLATGSDDPFRYFKQQIGAPRDVIQAKVDSPFDYAKQATLYLPPALPEPNDPMFLPAAGAEIERILNLSNGRAFVLFTSYNAMNSVYDAITHKLPYPCKKQGEMPRHRLIEWFKETESAVLFATASFWEGVSIDGDQLSCVIIDRIPFQAPDDPVYEARCDALKNDAQASWFMELALPHAIMRLKQGVGRLIRTKTDSGIVALLDARITKKMYGKTILSCLPPMTVTKKLQGMPQVISIGRYNNTPTEV
jgi:ATP-dependent DNA helicase DinG